MIDPAILRALEAAGASTDMILAAVEADALMEAERRARQIPWPKLRALAFERDGYACGYCKETEGPFEVDHIIPRANGGEDTLENVIVSCRGCNRAKKDREGDEWAAVYERRQRDKERKRAERAAKRGLSEPVRGQHGHSGQSEDQRQPAPLDKKSPQTPKELIPPGNDSLPACEDLDFPEGITSDLWAGYRAMRRKIRKPLTANAERLALKHLRQFAEDGHPPGAIVEAAIVGSYQGLFPPKGSKNGRHQPYPGPAEHEWGRTVAAADSLIDELRAEAAQHG